MASFPDGFGPGLGAVFDPAQSAAKPRHAIQHVARRGPVFLPGKRERRKLVPIEAVEQIAPDADNDDAVSRLRQPVVLGPDHEVRRTRFSAPGSCEIARRGERDKPVAVSSCGSQVVKHPSEDARTVERGREQPLDVLHHERRGSKPVQDADVLLIEPVATVFLGHIARDALIAGAPGK